MSDLSSINKKILERYFGMESGIVLDFSNRTFEEHFRDEFSIEVYSSQYDTPDCSESKANRLRGIWRVENNQIVGKIINSLIEYKKIAADLDTDFDNTNPHLEGRVQDIADELLNEQKIPERKLKSTSDYAKEIVVHLRSQYESVLVTGLAHDYTIGVNPISQANNTPKDTDEYNHKLAALEELKKTGLIKNYTLETAPAEEPYHHLNIDTAKIIIDEGKLTPQSTEVHNYRVSHVFENSIQQEAIDINLNNVAPAKSSEKFVFPHKIPSGTDWSNVTMVFHNNEDVTISVKGDKAKATFVKMGFRDARSGKPNMQWELLKILAKYNGSLRSEQTESKEAYKKQKQLLSDKLKEYFMLDTDPFIPYDTSSGYELKMTIFYAQKSKSKKVKERIEDPFDDLSEYTDEQLG